MKTPLPCSAWAAALRRSILGLVSLHIAALTLTATLPLAAGQPSPEPPVVTPGLLSGPPSDAVVLFDGKDYSKWRDAKGNAPRWGLEDDAMVVKPTGSIFTKQEFGACQLHIEWSSPREVKGEGQGRGNSGVYLQGRYEIQVLDSYQNKTYPNGQAGAFYGHFAPLVNPCHKPGEWNTYDIVFHPPTPGADGKSVVPGSFTVFFNGVLVQDHVPVQGSTTAAAFTGAVPKGPLTLQDHGNPVRYRNIWIRPL